MKQRTILVVLALAGAMVFGLGCEDKVNLGDVRPVVGLGQDWDGDGVVEPLPDDPGEGDHLVDFGQVVVLQRSSRVVVLSNDASAKDELTWTSIELVEGSSPDFYLDPPPVNDLLPGATTYFTVHYIPDTDGPDEGAVVVRSNDPDHPELVVSLAGEGVSPDIQVCLVGPDGELCNDQVEPSNLSADFGMLDLGDSADHQVVVRNVGEFTLTLSAGAGQGGVDLELNASSEFTLVSPFTGQIQPGAEETFTISYSPFDGGADETRLEVHSDDPDEPLVVIDLLGNGLAPKICPEPPFIVDFGSISVEHSAQRSYTFTSCGNQTLTITDLDLDPGMHGYFSFAVNVVTPFDLAPGESFDVQLTYAPMAEGAHAGKLFIYSNDPNAGEGYIDLVGKATPEPACLLSIHPAAVAFGNVSTSGFSNQTISLTNNGDANCDITEVRGPDGSAEFSFPNTPYTGLIPPGEMRQFTVRYQPVDEGLDEGTVTIVNDEGVDAEEFIVPLNGAGVEPPPCDLQADPALLNFGSVPVAGRAELTTTIHNFGGEECYITEADLSAGSDTSFHPTALPFPRPQLGPGQSYDLVVSVEPEHGGALSGSIVIKGSDSNPFWGTPMSTVNLSAGGESAQMCLDPETLSFGPVAVGDQRDMTFNIVACGPGNLRIRQIAFDGANPDFTFATVPGAPRTIPAGTSHTVTVRYSPSSPGADFGRVLISGNDDDDPTGVVELTGNYAGSCPAVFDCQPDALWFEQTELGRSRDQAFLCTNHGIESLTVQSVDLGAGTSPEFHLGVDPMPVTVNPGESIHVEVSYIPADVGPDNGSVVISSIFSSDGCDNFTLITVPLEAEGVTPDLPPCIGPQDFQPELIFEWPGNQNITDPAWKQVFMTPVVINLTDDDGDGFINENDVPDIVFNSYDYFHDTNPVITPAKLRAISGDDGHEIWTITDSRFRTNNESQVAAGDIDGDNLPEILALKYVVTDSGDITGQYVTGNILCFEHDGTFKWESEAWHAPEDDIEDGSAIGIADLDHDGHPEIFRGSSVFNYRGELIWEGEAGRGGAGHGVFSTAADLDMAGNMELVCGNTAYRSDGTIFWQAGKPDGMAAVADFNQDGYPEVLLSAVGFGGGVFLLDGRTGAVLSTLGDGEVNAILVPVIADLDGTGGPEIGMVGTCTDPAYPDDNAECFWGIDVDEANFGMTVLWKELINDSTLGGGNSAFDFEGDGIFEMLQNDENYVNIYRGLGHTQIYQAERWSITGWENPLVVDVNNDNHAEIIVIENGIGMGGLLVYGNAGPVKWVETKRVWNQYDYHITNVRENGTIPRFEVPNWTVYNSFLANEPFCE